MKEIQLSQGKVAIVDDEDFEWLSQWKWCFRQQGYAGMGIVENGKQRIVYMHRLIAGTPKGMDTDHIDKNKLNNQRKNLRICTHEENCRNRSKSCNNTTGVKCVVLDSRTGRFRAYIKVKYRQIHIGMFDSIVEASSAHLKAQKYHFGTFSEI